MLLPTLAIFQFFEYSKVFPASGPSHMLSLCLENPVHPSFAMLTPFHPINITLNIIF